MFCYSTIDDLYTGTEISLSHSITETFLNPLKIFVSSGKFFYFSLFGFFGVWGVGFLVYLLHWVSSMFMVRKLLSGSQEIPIKEILECVERTRQLLFLNAKIRICQSDHPISPFVSGIWKPTLFIPSTLVATSTLEDIRAVVAHELAHLVRRDFVVYCLMQWLIIFLWFIPPVWWLRTLLYRTQDLASDEYASVLLGSGLEFGESLVRIIQQFSPANNTHAG